MDIHQLYIPKLSLKLGETIKICSLPPDSTFISMEDNGDDMVIIYSTPSESEITVDIGRYDKQWTGREIKQLKEKLVPKHVFNKILP